jgi:uncharacterized peroxidase-related enzyme
MSHLFSVPTKNEVNETNQGIFDNLNKAPGFVPNLYATFAYSDNALSTYLAFQNAPTSLSKKEKEVINLVVSQVNDCRYCQSAHTVIGKLNGFTEEQVLEIRKGSASFNQKLDALVKFAKAVAENRGRVPAKELDAFFEAGYTKGNLVDIILVVADKIVMNYLHNITQVPIDFPVAPEVKFEKTAELV